MSVLLETSGLTAFYGDFQALYGVDMTLAEGETVAVIGANGAGKSTLMRSIAGSVRQASEMIRLSGTPIGHLSADRVNGVGITLVPEGRRLFPSLTVEENLLIGGWRSNRTGPWTLEEVYRLFPVLNERRTNPALALSGGQQQMVAIGRALMSNPKVLLCDEISLGLAPVVIRDIYAAVPSILARGASLIIVEQNIEQALGIADRVYCLMEGRVTLEGRPGEIDRAAMHNAYFGVQA